ncbi:WD40 repeat domain-containing protein [Planktothricoides raciborskii]|uniref:BIG2 domain-containing protein n=1 Tax=Planktothricoides raciborskii FACHB-1370 TaxID=2949576 RepID=A0ABR8EBX5_9CYAN|nr:hypothetical protein [Planktothricoides raciborskii]MBD2543659.1 hypothetical protein [Planktothricoides raciborskii FACHB-1370]MBD2582449.1 hypothetical protein [Planktothricoides raciborskii FACHB-1261]
MSTQIERIKVRLASQNDEERLDALLETLNCGQDGLELLIEQSLKDQSEKIRQLTYRIFMGDRPHLNESPEKSTDIITSIAISPNTPNTIRIVGGSYRKIWIWNLKSKEITCYLKGREQHSHWILSVAISPDGNRLVSGSADKTIKVWDLNQGNLIHTLKGHDSWVTAVAITADGKNIISGSTDKSIRVWDLNTGKLINTLKNDKELSSVLTLCLTHDQTMIVIGDTNNNITLWDLKTGQWLRSLEGHSDWIKALTVTSDNTTLISGSRDGMQKFWQSNPDNKNPSKLKARLAQVALDIALIGSLFLWKISISSFTIFLIWLSIRLIYRKKESDNLSAKTIDCIKTLPECTSINSLDCNFAQDIFFIGSFNKAKILNLKNNELIKEWTVDGFISSVLISPDASILAFAGQDWITLLDAKTRKPLPVLQGCSYSRLSTIKIIDQSNNQKLYTGDIKTFTVKVVDQNNQPINIDSGNIVWDCFFTGYQYGVVAPGKLQKNNNGEAVFIAGEKPGFVDITVKVGILEDSITINIQEAPKISKIKCSPHKPTKLLYGQSFEFKVTETLDQYGSRIKTTSIQWLVEPEKYGIIDENGNFTAGQYSGTCYVYASVGSIKSERISIEIIEPPKLTKLLVINNRLSNIKLEYGKTLKFEVKGVDQYGEDISTGTITWSVDDDRSGTIDEDGNFTAGQYSGTCYVYASVGSIKSERISITILEPPKLTKLQVINRLSNIKLEYQETFQFEVKGVDQYGEDISTGTITWSVDDDRSGTIDEDGNFTAGEYSGTCDVYASVDSIESERISITIIEPPYLKELQVINRPYKELEYGETFQFEVEGVDQYGYDISTGTITWSVNDDRYGTIDEDGNFTAGEYSGNCYVYASVSSIESERILIEIIEPPKLKKLLVINRPSKELEYEETFKFEVKGVDQYGNYISTGKINWSVNDEQSGTIDKNGNFTAGQYSGTCDVWASVGSIESERILIAIIEPSRLEKIELKPSFVSLLPEQTQKFVIVARDQRKQEIPLNQKIQINNQEYNIPNDIEYEVSEKLTFQGIDYNREQKKVSCKVTVNQDGKGDQEIIIKIGDFSAKATVYVQPVLRKIEISPKDKELKPEESFTFTLKGFDQTDQPYDHIFNVQWKTTTGGFISLGSVSAEGIFRGDYKRREVTVTASVGDISDTAKVILLPVLRRLRIKPRFVYLKPNDQQIFTVQGFDQFKNEIDPGDVYWEATGGKITQDGILSLDENDLGYFQVTVTSRVQPKYTQKVRKIFLYFGISTGIISYLISYESLIEDVLAFDSKSKLVNPQKQLTEANTTTESSTETESTEQLDLTTDSSTDTQAESTEQLDSTTDSSTDTQTESTEQLDSTTDSSTDTQAESTEQLDSTTDSSTDTQTESTEQLDSTTDSSTDTQAESTEQLDLTTDSFTESTEQLDSQSGDIQQVIEPVVETEIVKDTNFFDDFYLGLEQWFLKKLRKLIAKVFRSISNFCLTQADAPLSASADVFVLKNESNPYKHFECLKTLKGHSGIVSSLAITPDGEKLITASWDNTIKIWNLTSGELLHTLKDHADDVECVAITPDGQTLLSAGWDSTIKIWDLKTNKLENDLNFSRRVVFVTPTLDGQKFISGEAYNLIKVWDLNSLEINQIIGELIGSYNHPYYWHNCIVISPDQEKIYVGNTVIKSYNLITGKLLNIMDEGNLGLVYALAITPNGQTLISGHEGMIKIWDLASNPASEVKLTLNSSAKAVYALKLTPDGKTIISAGRKSNENSENNDSDKPAAEESIIEVWDLNTGELLHAITEKADNDNYVYSLEITPDGTNIITGYENGEIKIWGVAELSLVEN